MPEFKSFRRHPAILLATLAVLAVASWVGYYLATFDLNNYRTHLAEVLSQQLHMPVQLGEAHVELREGGIAFRFSRLQIGSEETPAELQAQDLWLQLAWRGLLLRKPIFAEVALDRPQVRMSPRPQPLQEEPSGEELIGLELLRDFQVRHVEVNHGTLDLTWLDQTGQVQSLRVHELTTDLGNLGLGRNITFDLNAKLPEHGGATRLVASGRIDLPEHGSWREVAWDITLEGKDLDAARLASLLPSQLQVDAAGIADLQLFAKGRHAETVTVQAEVSGQDLRIRPGSAYRRTVPLKHLQFAGSWQHQDRVHSLRQLTLQLDDLRLAGEVTFSSDLAGTQVAGVLGTTTLPLDTLRRWLPPDFLEGQPLLDRLQPGGNVVLEHAAWRATLPAAPQTEARLAIEALNGEARQLAWSIGEGKTASLSAVAVRLADGQWHLSSDSGLIASLPLSFTGTIAVPAATAPQLDFEVKSSLPAEQLPALWAKGLPAEASFAGLLQLNGRLHGTPERVALEAALDLAQLEVRYGEHLHLPPTTGALLSVQCQGSRQGVSISQASLNFPPFTGHLNGTIDWSETATVNVAGSLEIATLQSAYHLVPILDKLQLRGGATLELSLKGAPQALQPQLSLTLQDVGMPMHRVIGDISQLQGRLLLEGRGLRSDTLTAQIGMSPVTFKARVADLNTPQLELDIKSPAIHASDLIFHSPRAMLRDLSGQLLIDGEGIVFKPVNVRLDNGTRATINGSVRNFSAPRVGLDITGEYANVEEIIQLWTDESPAAKAERQARAPDGTGHLPEISIAVKAGEGDLYGMKFSNASALIVPTAERLLIHPLDFSVGDGYCTTQVLVEHDGSSTRLRASGHLENVDAYAVYNELLDRKSIMRGTLRGDFFLEGELGGAGWLPTSYGNVNVAVHNGVMRHSPLLSTIFSLLNVSQLFQFKLPDINLEGLPFSRLATELTLDKGILSTERLILDSEAMNMAYAGKYDMVNNQLDMLVVAKPLGTIDKVVTRLPIAGWILGGEEKALITAQFRVTGSGDKPKVEAIPITAISKGVLGLFQRALGLPLKLVEDPAILWGGGGKKN